MRLLCIVFCLFLLASIPSEAREEFLPEFITIEDSNYKPIGYIDVDGAVMDVEYNLIGYIRRNGGMEDSSLVSIGFFDGTRFQDENFNLIGSFTGNRLQNIGFVPIGYVEGGRIEGQNFKPLGYYIGRTGGQDWVIAAFCFYYTNMFFPK